MDSQNRVIAYEELFRGTLSQTSVYPREVVLEALKRNAASAILCHNHPSGSPQPSRADEALTLTLKSALALVDVRVLDHMIVTRSKVLSFAEEGLLRGIHRASNGKPHGIQKEKRARRRVFTGFLAEQAGFEPAVGY